MSTVDENTVPALSRLFRFQWEEAQQCYVILYPEGMVKLSPSAGEIMSHSDGRSSVGGIIGALSKNFPGADLQDDVLAFFTEAQENGWMELN